MTTSNSNNNYNEKLDALNSQFFSVLDDYKKYYVFYNKNPEYSDYAQAFSHAKNIINGLNRDVNAISVEVQGALNKLNDSMTDINTKIEQEKETNDQLKNSLSQIKETKSASNIMNKNYKEMYRVQYVNNISILLGILISITMIFKVYSTKPV